MARYQINKRLWLLLTLAIWVPWLFLWPFGKAADEGTVASMVWDGLQDFVRHGLSPDHVEDVLGFIFIITLPLVPAAAIGWVIHCPIVMALSERKKAPAQLTTDH